MRPKWQSGQKGKYRKSALIAPLVYRQGHRGKRFVGELGRYVQKNARSTMHRSKGSRQFAKTGSAALTAKFYALVAYVKYFAPAGSVRWSGAVGTDDVRLSARLTDPIRNRAGTNLPPPPADQQKATASKPNSSQKTTCF